MNAQPKYDGVSMLDVPFADVFDEWERRTNNYKNIPMVRALCMWDRYFLLVQIFGRKDMLHSWLYARCREVEKNPDGYLDLWAREHYKSTIITFAGIIQEILVNAELTVGIFSHTKSIAKKFLWQIKQELQGNQKLKTLFPDILFQDPEKESPQWSLDAGLVVRRKTNSKEATVEAHGLVDGMPTSAHFALLVYDDVVTKESVNTPEQVAKTTEMWELSDNLGMQGGRKWHIGTRYCTIGSMRITMGDWTQKPIEQIAIGDEIIGWELRDNRRWLRKAKVVNRGTHRCQPVNKYTFDHGRSVVCTDDHKWWRGAHGGGPEYAPLGFPKGTRKDRLPKGHRTNGRLTHICELLVPVDKDYGRDAGWLAGMFDGEGTTKKNKFHPSGLPCITQTMFNPELVEEIKACLTRLRFGWTESWVKPAPHRKMNHDRCMFSIIGGWRERYRFFVQIAPNKIRNLLPTLFGQLSTERHKLVSIEPQEPEDVHWLETETGNYVIEGFCSSNSYADTYEAMMKRGAVKPRIYPATHDGTISGNPILLTKEEWDRKVRDQGEATISTQMLQNPLAGQQRMFDIEDLQTYEVRPATLAVYIMVDPARSKKTDSDNTAIVVLGIDYANNKYLLDGYNHKMDLMERWERTAQMYVKWKQATGIQGVYVGYESFGAQADLDYFKEQMKAKSLRFEIKELAWPREGGGSKIDRVQRLGPDFRSHKFFLPYDTDEKKLTASQQKMMPGYGYRLAKPIHRKDGENNIYNLVEQFKFQVHYFPFGGKKDLVDAASRIYDMTPMRPSVNEPRYLEAEWS